LIDSGERRRPKVRAESCVSGPARGSDAAAERSRKKQTDNDKDAARNRTDLFDAGDRIVGFPP
jgi:hypothetical protein